MKLIIGGRAQGKLSYAVQIYEIKKNKVWESVLPEVAGDGQTIVINHFHNWVKERIGNGGSPEEEISAWLAQHQDCIIISDEIGNGIVPIEAAEREYRERTGRLLVELAGQAEEVVRVICGLGQKIK